MVTKSGRYKLSASMTIGSQNTRNDTKALSRSQRTKYFGQI